MKSTKKIRSRHIPLVLTLVLIAGTLARSAQEQPAEKIPLPEFYGTYAVADGRIVGIEPGQPAAGSSVDVQLGRLASAFDVCQKGAPPAQASSASVPVLPGNTRFLVFFQPSGALSPMTVAGQLQLFSMAYLRSVRVECGPNNRREGDAGAWMPAWGKVAELLVKPVPRQPEMVLAVPGAALSPGVYKLSGGALNSGFIFAVQPVGNAEESRCADFTYSFNMYLFVDQGIMGLKGSPCGTLPHRTPSAVNPALTAPQPAISRSASCGDYTSCAQAASAALASSQWNDATAAWDKTLSLGGPLALVVCRENTFGCEQGTMSLGTKEVSFTRSGRKLFAVLPSQVTPVGVVNEPSIASRVAFRLKIEGKNYNFDFLPAGVTCQIPGRLLQCPEQAVAQQLAVANYIISTLKLGVPSAQPAADSSLSAPASAPNPTACSQASDLGYSILLQGHLYQVRGSGPAGLTQSHLFIDEKGIQVTDPNVLQQLATAAWTRENVTASLDARNGINHVSGILGTSRALQVYSAVQDALARAMVEAVVAGATGGTSLSKPILNITVGALKSQLLNAPKTLFTLAAQRGLEMSLEAYKQMEAVPLPPVDAAVLNAPDLIKIKSFFLQARTLELPYEALAAKLMPTDASQLTNQVFASAISELIPSVGLNSNDQVTLKALFDFQKSVANLGGNGGSLPALRDYSQNLNLALNLAEANNRTVSQWATAAATGSCAQTAASR